MVKLFRRIPYLALLFGAASASNDDGIRDCLRKAVGGDPLLVAFPDQLFYELIDVNRYNLNIPVTPAAVTFPRSSDQIAAIVKCAADRGYKVQPKGGGHSYGNYGLGGKDGAIVVDLRSMKQFSMDSSNWHATIGAGLLLGEIDQHLHDNGKRAMAHGTCPQVGIGGHATIGGLGPTGRQWGTALDHILEVEVVLANSSIIRASETQHSEVLFAVKGAAASFGIVTEFTVRTEPQPDKAVQYSFTFGFGNTTARANMLKEWQAFVSAPDLSRKLASTFTVLEHTVIVSGTFFGDEAEYKALHLEDRFPGSTNGTVIVFDNWLGLLAEWAQDVAQGIGGYVPTPFYSKSLSFTNETLIPATGIDNLFEYLDNTKKDALLWFVIFDLAGGATNDVPADATGYAHRDGLFWLQSYAISIGNVSQTTHDFLDGASNIITDSLPEIADNGAYPGYVDPLMSDGQQKYWRYNLDRLEEIKTLIDPNDVFHNPQSVRPKS